jgi:hypothetical protein
MTSLDRIIDQSVHCVRCGMPGIGNCACYRPCPCGWFRLPGEPCQSRDHDARMRQDLDRRHRLSQLQPPQETARRVDAGMADLPLFSAVE